MVNYYDITTKIKDYFDNEVLIKKITKGGLDDIANAKREEYALAHLIVNQCNPQDSSLVYNVSVIAMDIVDVNKDETTDNFSRAHGGDRPASRSHAVAASLACDGLADRRVARIVWETGGLCHD